MRALIAAPWSFIAMSLRPTVILYTAPDCSPAWPTICAILAVSIAAPPPLVGVMAGGFTWPIKSNAGFTRRARSDRNFVHCPRLFAGVAHNLRDLGGVDCRATPTRGSDGRGLHVADQIKRRLYAAGEVRRVKP